jgi:hypothetical protein
VSENLMCMSGLYRSLQARASIHPVATNSCRNLRPQVAGGGVAPQPQVCDAAASRLCLRRARRGAWGGW